MPAVWPPSIPQIQLLGFSEGGGNPRIYHQTESGPGKVRSKFSTAPKPIQVQVVLRGSTENNDFWTFYEATLFHGALPFEWTSARKGSVALYRFKPDTVPRLNLIVGGADQVWRGVLELELMPEEYGF